MSQKVKISNDMCKNSPSCQMSTSPGLPIKRYSCTPLLFLFQKEEGNWIKLLDSVEIIRLYALIVLTVSDYPIGYQG